MVRAAKLRRCSTRTRSDRLRSVAWPTARPDCGPETLGPPAREHPGGGRRIARQGTIAGVVLQAVDPNASPNAQRPQ
eukprot:11196615-Lingulodinium_polyedra.AAC.1